MRDRPAPTGEGRGLRDDGFESGPEASSMGRAATTGRNLWPRPGRRDKGRDDDRGDGSSPRPGARGAGPRTGAAGGVAGRPSASRASAKSRRELGGDQVEGRQAVRELLAARRREVREVFMMEGNDPAAILREIESLARSAHVPVRLVTQRQLQEIQGTEAPQGVVAFAEPIEEVTLEELVGLGPVADAVEALEAFAEVATPPASAAGDDEVAEVVATDRTPAPHERQRAHASSPTGVPFLLVVDGVTDPQNLGALLRSAECAGVTGVVIARHRAAHLTPTVTKAAAGAIEHVKIAVVPGIPGALQDLQRLGVWTVGLDERGKAPLFDLRLGDGPIALVVGAEGRGLAPLARQRCDVLARIPLHGAIDSLNVSAAGAVVLFEVTRQRGLTPSTRPR